MLLLAGVVANAGGDEADLTSPDPLVSPNAEHHDCWALGEPGAGLLPPCNPDNDPDAVPAPEFVLIPESGSVTSFGSNDLEDICPSWWQFWMSDWIACSD